MNELYIDESQRSLLMGFGTISQILSIFKVVNIRVLGRIIKIIKKKKTIKPSKPSESNQKKKKNKIQYHGSVSSVTTHFLSPDTYPDSINQCTN